MSPENIPTSETNECNVERKRGRPRKNKILQNKPTTKNTNVDNDIILHFPISSHDVNKEQLNEEPKKFKNSSVISPVFGIKSDNEYKKLEAYKRSDVRNIEDEIKKTEEFLSE